MNTTYYVTEMRRILRDPVSLFFTAVLPAFFYVIFGANQGYSSESAGNGNVASYIMISMAAYGAVVATTATGGGAAVERMQGWGRQLGLTPMRDSQYVLVKSLVGLTVAAIPVVLIYALGVITGAQAPARVWVLSAVLVLLGASIFSVYGLLFGLTFKSEGAVGAASGSLVILAFLGNLFFPLSGAILTIAKFTPLYGIVALARYPQTEGFLVSTEGPGTQDPLWIPVANVAVWMVVLVLTAVLVVRRGRSRQ